MARVADGIDLTVNRVFGREAVLATTRVSWGLRISEQVLRLEAKSAGIVPGKVGRTLAWSRADVRRLLAHLHRRRRTGGAGASPPTQAA